MGVNGKRTTSGNWIDLNRVNALIDTESGMRARHVLVIADSCFSGNIFRGDEEFITSFNIDSLAWHQAQIKPTSRTALTSDANEPVLDRATNKSAHSVFAKELIRQLKNQRSVISAGKLHQLIEKDVFARAKRQNLTQSSQYGSISGTGHSGGDFIFIPRSNKTAFINLNQKPFNSPQDNQRGNLQKNLVPILSRSTRRKTNPVR